MFTSQSSLKDWLVNEVKLGLNDGQSFGGESHVGDGFMRINLAVSRQTIQDVLGNFKKAKKSISLTHKDTQSA